MFTVVISGNVNPGDIIANYALITNPDGPGALPVAPNVIVSPSQVPASGNKFLYLDTMNTTPILTRIPPTVNTNNEIAGLGASDDIDISPATQDTLTIGAGNIPVSLWIGRNNRKGDRTVTATLLYSGGSNGTIGSNTQTFNLTTDGTAGAQLVNFTIPLASDLTLDPGTTLTLQINNDTNKANRSIYVYSTLNGSDSAANISINPVINVDSLEWYDAAYPAGTPVSQVLPGTSLYLRAVISDPFGSFDIASAHIDITDPDIITVVSGVPMTQVNDSGTATNDYA